LIVSPRHQPNQELFLPLEVYVPLSVTLVASYWQHGYIVVQGPAEKPDDF